LSLTRYDAEMLNVRCTAASSTIYCSLPHVYQQKTMWPNGKPISS